jgi:hypothetical protein
MGQVDWAAAESEHLLSPFSSPFFGVKVLYDYWFCSSKAVFWQQTLNNYGLWEDIFIQICGVDVAKSSAKYFSPLSTFLNISRAPPA